MDKDELFARADNAIAQSLLLRAERRDLEEKGALARADVKSSVWALACERTESDAYRQDRH